MKNPFLRCAALSLTLLLGYSTANACTEITLKAKSGAVVIGRTLEFGPNLASYIMTEPRGKNFKMTAPNGKPGVSWRSKYGYVYMDYFHSGHPLDGMNEKGLSFADLYLPGDTQYPSVPQGKASTALPYTYLGDWVLGNFTTVAQVEKALQNVTVFSQPESFPGHPNVVFPLHVIITDAQGHSIVIEFLKGKMHVYHDKIGILTNSPTFPWQMTNLKNYANLSPYSPAPIKIDGYVYAGTGQGSGMQGLPGDTTPPSRFVKVAFLTKTALPVKNSLAAVNLAQHILNTVDIPNGLVRGVKGTKDENATETTQWTVFKDLTHRVLYFTSYNNTALQAISLSQLNFSPNAPQLKMPLAGSSTPVLNVTKRLVASA